jgi:predicted DNA-binding transcriptional regulator AlpA
LHPYPYLGESGKGRRVIMNDHFYTAREAQTRLGLSKAMFFRKVNEGLIPKVVLPGMKQGVYPKRDIDALVLSMNMLFEQYDKIAFSKSTPADQVEEMNIGIRCFGSDFITPLPERIAFQQKSDFTFHSLKVDGRVMGYISMFRLPEEFLDDLLTSRKIERNITLREVLPFVRLEPFSIYIDVVAVDPNLPKHMRHLYAGILISRFMDLLSSLIANGYELTRIYTVTATIEGDNLVRKLGFRLMEGKSMAPGRTPYEYVLDQRGLERLRNPNYKGLR